MTEIDINNFIDIPGYPNYKIKIATNEVMSLKFSGGTKQKLLSNKRNDIGHHYVTLHNNGISHTFGLQKIVMLIKEGPCPKGMEVCHNDGNPENNHPDNLRYDTHKNNMQDMKLHGTHANLGKRGGHTSNSRKINQFSKSGELLNSWDSLIECERAIGIPLYCISKCARGTSKTAGGFVFKYA